MPRIFIDAARGDALDLNPAKWNYSALKTNGALYRASGYNVFQGGTTGQWVRPNIQAGQTDFDVTATIKAQGAASGASVTKLIGRASSDLLGTLLDSPTSGYAVVIDLAAGTIGLWKQAGASAATQLGATITGLLTPDTDVKIRLSCVGTAIKLRAWLASASEPGTWNVSVTDSDVTSGVIEWVPYRETTAGQKLLVKDFAISAAVRLDGLGKGTLPGRSVCKLQLHPSGVGFMPNGAVVSPLIDDGITASMAPWLAAVLSTVSQDANTLRRRVDMAGNTYGAVAGQAAATIPTAGVKAIWVGVRSLILGATSNLQVQLSLVGASGNYQIRCNATDSFATLESVVTGIPASKVTQLPLVGAEGGRARNLAICLLPQRQQLVFLMDDQIVDWVDLPAIPAEPLYPKLTCRTVTSAASYMTYRQFFCTVETA